MSLNQHNMITSTGSFNIRDRNDYLAVFVFIRKLAGMSGMIGSAQSQVLFAALLLMNIILETTGAGKLEINLLTDVVSTIEILWHQASPVITQGDLIGLGLDPAAGEISVYSIPGSQIVRLAKEVLIL
jgi:hypothetical protein